jgi:hypothetical protein
MKRRGKKMKRRGKKMKRRGKKMKRRNKMSKRNFKDYLMIILQKIQNMLKYYRITIILFLCD